eukprot:GHVP01014636.1.p1 GENE.GHVP01014636.1~~GHVP01014636.1.p1  ORF type:complete len:114 (+),score=7.54 GHVP01014636.1:86-427(+)
MMRIENFFFWRQKLKVTRLSPLLTYFVIISAIFMSMASPALVSFSSLFSSFQVPKCIKITATIPVHSRQSPPIASHCCKYRRNVNNSNNRGGKILGQNLLGTRMDRQSNKKKN